MKVVITGGSGFLGRPLARRLAAEGADVVVLTRGQHASGGNGHIRFVTWTSNEPAGAWAQEIDGAAAVINLAGESIAGRRWTPAQKQAILDSRVDATRSIVAAIRSAASPPAVLVNGSAVGYYGPHGHEVVTEDTPAGDDFLAHVCTRWEAEAERASGPVTRVVCIRTGLVLEKDGGALPQMLPPFKFGVGGPIGSGQQYWPWIHREDWIGLVLWTLRQNLVSGPLNATAPEPVTNTEFARALGRALHRPAFMPAPAFALRLLLGEMADALLLSGQRAVPRRAEQAGFTFTYTNVDAALRAIFTA
ncbi:MAG TPA: TIGR01777 family oxidoreductase [Vicinamibacterales bacterium]|jgi:hypothetical protein